VQSLCRLQRAPPTAKKQEISRKLGSFTLLEEAKRKDYSGAV
jgi:hypothetical protein